MRSLVRYALAAALMYYLTYQGLERMMLTETVMCENLLIAGTYWVGAIIVLGIVAIDDWTRKP